MPLLASPRKKSGTPFALATALIVSEPDEKLEIDALRFLAKLDVRWSRVEIATQRRITTGVTVPFIFVKSEV